MNMPNAETKVSGLQTDDNKVWFVIKEKKNKAHSTYDVFVLYKCKEEWIAYQGKAQDARKVLDLESYHLIKVPNNRGFHECFNFLVSKSSGKQNRPLFLQFCLDKITKSDVINVWQNQSWYQKVCGIMKIKFAYRLEDPAKETAWIEMHRMSKSKVIGLAYQVLQFHQEMGKIIDDLTKQLNNINGVKSNESSNIYPTANAPSYDSGSFASTSD